MDLGLANTATVWWSMASGSAMRNRPVKIGVDNCVLAAGIHSFTGFAWAWLQLWGAVLIGNAGCIRSRIRPSG
jgi:hypothetical protein